MNTHVCVLVLCISVASSINLTMAINAFEFQKLLNKMDSMKDKLHAVEQTVLSSMESLLNVIHIYPQNKMSVCKLITYENNDSLKGMEQRLHERLTKHENGMNEKIEQVDTKFETRMSEVQDFLENIIKIKLEEVKTSLQQTVDGSVKEKELASKKRFTDAQETLANLEKNIKERIDKVGFKLESGIQTMENSLKSSEVYTREELFYLKNQLINKTNNIVQQQNAHSKFYQTALQMELGNQEENKKTLDVLTDSVRNMSILSEKSSKILMTHFVYPIHSCRHVTKQASRYIIHLEKSSKPLEVICEPYKFDGGWTVIQRRFDGSVDFYRNWTEYRNGFGNVDGEFWLGLEYMHQMTKNRPHELLVELKDFYGNYGYAKYEEFEIGSESELYKLKKIGSYSGTAGDAMSYNRHNNFSTYDRNNGRFGVNCAKEKQGAWWYLICSDANLNGLYQNTTHDHSSFWYDLKTDKRGMSYSRMMIRDIIH